MSAFPSLFPRGRGGNYREIDQPLTTSEMLAHCVGFADPRFSQDYRFVFMMTNIKALEAGYKSIAGIMKGRMLQKDANGDIEDITEEWIDRMGEVVCRLLYSIIVNTRISKTVSSWMI